MRVSEILRTQDRPVERIEHDRSVYEAINQLVEKGIGSLLVSGDGGEVAGIVTERDIMRVAARSCDELAKIRVSEIMTSELVTGGPDDYIVDLLQLMTERRIRHLPIMNDGELAGLVSIGDLVKAEVALIQEENRHLRDYISQGG